MFTDKTIGIVGVGNMGEVLLRGLLTAETADRAHLLATEVLEDRRSFIVDTYGIEVTNDNRSLAHRCDILVLAVKPQYIDQVLADMAEAVDESLLIVSIAAGITTERIGAAFGDKNVRIIRVMPNAPALVLEGASALFAGKNATEDDMQIARGIFETVGKTVVVQSEELMDVVTGLSGSGPAFVFMMIEALSDAGVQLGLARKVSNLLASQTVFGAAKMFIKTGRHAGELRDLVATPGGTTFAGLRELERGTFRSTVMDAVEAASLKSKALGQKK